MTTYQLTGEGYVIRDGDTKVPTVTTPDFPNTNPDYLAYKQWLADGGVPLPADAPSQSELDRIVAAKVDALWLAAHRYTSGYISGVAIGILTIGVLQQQPKAMAVSAWSGSVWAEYYARKALVTAGSVDNLDFSSFGPIPHSVPELQAEVGL